MKFKNNFKNNFKFKSLILSLLILSLFSISVVGDVGVSTCQELQDTNLNTSIKYYLTNNIDCSDSWNWNLNSTIKGFQPIAADLDGNNFQISNVYINKTDTSDFLGFSIGSYSKIKNVILNNFHIESKGDYVGILDTVNRVYLNNIHIKNSYVKGRNYVGGFVSYVDSNFSLYNSSIENSMIEGYDRVGGLIGETYYHQIIENCKVINNNIKGHIMVGGLVGASYDFRYKNDYVYNNTITGSSRLGGLIGISTSDNITNVYYEGTIINTSALSIGNIAGIVSGNITTHNVYFSTDSNFNNAFGDSVSYNNSKYIKTHSQLFSRTDLNFTDSIWLEETNNLKPLFFKWELYNGYYRDTGFLSGYNVNPNCDLNNPYGKELFYSFTENPFCYDVDSFSRLDYYNNSFDSRIDFCIFNNSFEFYNNRHTEFDGNSFNDGTGETLPLCFTKEWNLNPYQDFGTGIKSSCGITQDNYFYVVSFDSSTKKLEIQARCDSGKHMTSMTLCKNNITKPCYLDDGETLTLQNDIYINSSNIGLLGNDITLDCNNYHITGSPNIQNHQDYELSNYENTYLFNHNITLKNCNIEFTEKARAGAPIYFKNVQGDLNLINNNINGNYQIITFSDLGFAGITINNYGDGTLTLINNTFSNFGNSNCLGDCDSSPTIYTESNYNNFKNDVFAFSSGNNKINAYNNNFNNATGSGLFLYYFDGGLIYNNSFYKSYLYLRNSANIKVYDNNIKEQLSYFGYYTLGLYARNSNNITYYNNKVTGQLYGLYARDSNNLNFNNNIVSTLPYLAVPYSSSGIYLRGVSYDNTFINNSLSSLSSELTLNADSSSYNNSLNDNYFYNGNLTDLGDNIYICNHYFYGSVPNKNDSCYSVLVWNNLTVTFPTNNLSFNDYDALINVTGEKIISSYCVVTLNQNDYSQIINEGNFSIETQVINGENNLTIFCNKTNASLRFNACVPDFYCFEYGSEENNIIPCINVSDSNNCNLSYLGLYSDFNQDTNPITLNPKKQSVEFSTIPQALYWGMLLFLWLILIIVLVTVKGVHGRPMQIFNILQVMVGLVFGLGFLQFNFILGWTIIFIGVGTFLSFALSNNLTN